MANGFNPVSNAPSPSLANFPREELTFPAGDSVEERVTISTRITREKGNYFVVPIFAPPAIRLRNSICPGKSMEKTSILKRLGTVESFIESLPKCYLTLSTGKSIMISFQSMLLSYQALPNGKMRKCIGGSLFLFPFFFFFLFFFFLFARDVRIPSVPRLGVALKRYSFVNAGRHVQSSKEQSSYA